MKTIDEITLNEGKHDKREHGLCVMEAVAWVAGEEHTDMPKCASPVISRYCQVLNDRGGPEVRERLKPYIYKIIGTASPELDLQRAFIAADFAVRVFAGVECEPIVDLETAAKGRDAANFAAAHAARYFAAYAAKRDDAFRCLDAMLWPVPAREET